MRFTETTPIIDKARYQAMIDNALNNGRKIPLEGLNQYDWLVLRTMLGLGGSEVASALGLNKWQTPFSVWKKKVSDEIDNEEKATAEVGNAIESGIITLYNNIQKREGRLLAVKDKFIRIHPEHDCLFVNLDAVVPDENGNEEGLMECKSTVNYVYKSWGNDEETCVQGIPLYHYCQVMHELSITGLPWCDLAIFILDQRKLVIKRIMRDDEYINKQNEALVKWWHAYVVPMVAPEYAASEIALLDPEKGSFVEADEETLKLVDMLKEAQKAKKTSESNEQALKDQLIIKIGEKEMLTSAGSVIATFKQQKRVSLNTDLIRKEEPSLFDRFGKTSEFRVLRLK